MDTSLLLALGAAPLKSLLGRSTAAAGDEKQAARGRAKLNKEAAQEAARREKQAKSETAAMAKVGSAS